MCEFYDELLEITSFQNKIKKFFTKNDFSNFFQSLKNAQYLIFPTPEATAKKTSPQQLLKSLETTQYAPIRINMPASIDSLTVIRDLWEFSREKFAETFCLMCQDFAKLIDCFEYEDLSSIQFNYKSFENKYLAKPPQTNFEFLDLLYLCMIKPLLSKFDKNHKNQEEIIQKTTAYLHQLFFFAAEIYDHILSKIKISNECSQFFGITGMQEIIPGKQIILESIEKRTKELEHIKIEKEKKAKEEEDLKQKAKKDEEFKPLLREKAFFEEEIKRKKAIISEEIGIRSTAFEIELKNRRAEEERRNENLQQEEKLKIKREVLNL